VSKDIFKEIVFNSFLVDFIDLSNRISLLPCLILIYNGLGRGEKAQKVEVSQVSKQIKDK